MSEVLEIHGGNPLNGSITVSGAKNAALPVLIACLLSPDQCTIKNVPLLEDIRLTLQLLEHFGAETSFHKNTATVAVPMLRATEASYSLVKALRASFWVLAPLLARGRAARVALPGGDAIGARPVDIHLEGLVQMGADISIKHGIVYATAQNGLKPINFTLRFPSVGATHQLIMAAAITPGTTVLDGAAREPEITALADFINVLGGEIEGAGTSKIVIHGKESLGGGTFSVIGDRIEAGTYILASAVAGGRVSVHGIVPDHLGAFLHTLSEMGIDIQATSDSLVVSRSGALRPVSIKTAPFPGFATDLQALLMAALCTSNGVSTIEEHIFEGRFGHVSELCRMGAQIKVSDHQAIITGVGSLTGAPVTGLDIRAAAALVIAALGAEGLTTIHDTFHIRRGYERMDKKFASLGAKIQYRITDPEDFLFVGC